MYHRDDKDGQALLHSIPQSEKLKAVEELKGVEDCLEEYRHSFSLRYHGRPFISPEGKNVVRSLVRELGAPLVKRALEHYVTMNDDWFLKTRHTLESLDKNANTVLASLYAKETKERSVGGAELMDEADKFVWYLFFFQKVYEAYGFEKTSPGILQREDLSQPITIEMVKEFAENNRNLMMSDVPVVFIRWLEQFKKPFFIKKPTS